MIKQNTTVMSIKKMNTNITHATSDDHIRNLKKLNADAITLTQISYTQNMKCNFFMLFILGVDFSLINS